MSFLDYFSDKADLYAQARPRYPDALFQFIAAAAPDTASVWDCGTGNGQAAISLAQHFCAVYASDPSGDQIAQAIPAPNVRYSTQPAEATTFAANQFDAVCVAQALHWFDLPRFFAELQRVTKPDALFIAWGYSWFTVSPDFDAACQRLIFDMIAPYWAPQNQLLWQGYRDIQLPFAPLEPPALSIEVSWNLYQLQAYVHTWSAVRHCMARQGEDFFTNAFVALAHWWGEPTASRLVTMPLHIIAGRKIISSGSASLSS